MQFQQESEVEKLMKRLVIGMAAHVDAGKTTLAEALLYKAGTIRHCGRVDNGDAFLDNNPIERERGITIFSKQAILRINDCEITILDTPGHMDFSAETERAISVLDAAVLVISGTDGVQPHTATLWELLRRAGVPVLVFVNKMDISYKSNKELLDDLLKLNNNFVEFNKDFPEHLAEQDEECMNSLLDSGEVPQTLISSAIAARRAFPVLFGSALKSNGVEELLTALEQFIVPKDRSDDFAALVYKITTDEKGARLTHIKVNGGVLKNRMVIDNSRDKISQIRVYNGAKFTTIDVAEPGQLCALAGLSQTFAGQALGAQESVANPLLEPILDYRIILPKGTDLTEALSRFKLLEQEDPQLKFTWNSHLNEIHVEVMGELQLEILQRRITERFMLDVTFDEGNISYRETIAEPIEGVGHYEPLRHYAEVHLLLEPLPLGSGLKFATHCNNLEDNWQGQVISALQERTHIGVLTGSPLTDMKITLVAGRAHQKHTEGGDFRQAAWRAVRQGLASTKSTLLEPFYTFKLEVPVSCVGRALTDLERMGADFAEPSGFTDFSTIKGSCSVYEMRGYQRDVNAYTHGLGRLTLIPKGYFYCHNAQEIINKIGYNHESDVENSADSVFCSHGAAILIKWSDVPKKMHIPYVFHTEKVESPTKSEISSYKQRVATDKELMEIFERTYGRINRKDRVAMRRDRDFEKPAKLPPPKRGEEFLLVDGYNIIFSWDELAETAKLNLDAARAQLINILCNYQGFRRCNVILVFDAYKVKSDREIEEYGNLKVIYTREAETADMFIEKTAYRLSADNRVRVATSDGTEQLIILGSGATRVSAREFKLEVNEINRAIQEILDTMHRK